MTKIQIILVALGVVIFIMAVSNRFANRGNYTKLKEILVEEKIQSKERSENEEQDEEQNN